jgi:CheY-like chemotaxis protein
MIRVLLAEDMRILRDTLVSVLNLEDDIKVVAQVAVGTDIVPAALAERPDLAVLDIDLPGADGLTAAAELHERLPACRVVILTVLGRPGQLRAALDAHVAGFMVKDAPSDQLIDVLGEGRGGGAGHRPEAGPGGAGDEAKPAVGAGDRCSAAVRGGCGPARDRGGAVPVLRDRAELHGIRGDQARRP